MKKIRSAAVVYMIISCILLPGCDESETQTEPQKTEEALYFPATNNAQWETVSPASLKWNESAIPPLLTLLEQNNSRAFIVLKNGRIAIEAYWGKQFDGTTNFSAASPWYWASAGKTLTSALAGIASAEGKLNLDSKTSTYLGAGWTSLSASQEDQITVRHQLAMTTGLDDAVANRDCTLKQCLVFKATPGTRWAYHNAPYTLLDNVIAAATGQTLNNYLQAKIKTAIGMDGQFIKTGDNNVYYSTARSMARFGLLLLSKGKWENTQVIPENYANQMTSTSQQINQSYGYLTWLNGKTSFMVPQSQVVFPGSMTPNAPADMYAAMGKNGQLINVVPSMNLVVIRMGDVPDDSLVPFLFQDDIWEQLKLVIN